ncbi:MAG TPA: hypothetical protein VNH19_24235 [Candidatus Limnocylindrales bacterium]|nr:hypothetical protein [Candidatus Limnocylindrales bacterium]
MTRAVDLSNSASFEDVAVMQCFEFLKQPAGIPFDSNQVRFPDPLPKASCM